MRRFPTSIKVTFCVACLISAAFSQITFSRQSYVHSGLLVGDFNHDGKPDLMGTGNGSFRVLLNNGDGTFRGPITTSQPGERRALVTADFNGDGRTDLVGCQIQNPDASPPVTEFAIWLGTGAGTFSQPQRFSLPGFCSSVAVEDFDKDGNQDAAVVWATQNPDLTPNNGITVFFGDGTGNISHSVTTDHISVIGQGDIPCGFSEVVAGNFDRTGMPDVMIGTFCNNETFDQSALVFGAGTGTGHFGFSQTDEANASLRLTKDDVNQDNRLDLFVAESLSGPHATANTGLVAYVDTTASGVPAWEKRPIYFQGGDGECVGRVSGGTAADLN